MVVHNSSLQAEQPALSFAEQLQYWRSQLEGVSVPELPIVQSRPTSMTSTIAARRFDVPQEAITRITDSSGQCGISLLELTVAVFQIVLARYTGRDDIAVVTPAPGQSHPVVLRSRLTESTSFIDFVLKVRATVGAAFAHSEVPFERLAEELGLEPELARAMVMC